MTTTGSAIASPSHEVENPYKAVGSHLIDSDIASINHEARILEEAEQACNNDPEIKKEIEKANQEQEQLMQEEFDKIYDRRVVYHIFGIVFMANILINIDHGALPGCYDQITHKLDINKFQYGVLGSFVFAGLTFGSIVSTALYSKGNLIKPTLLGSIIMNTIALLLFTTSSNYSFLLFLRGATGFFQIFLVVYQPVWTDTFCEERFKSIALTINMLAAPLGVVGGYMLTYYMVKYHTWEWSFYLQSVAIIPCFVFLLMVPEKYINVETTVMNKKRIQKEVGTEYLKRLDKSGESTDIKTVLSQSQSDMNDGGSPPSRELLLKRALIHNQKKKEKAMAGFNNQDTKENLSQKIQSMITNPVFCGLVGTMSGLYFVVTGLQYWVSAYMMNVLGASAEIAALYFVVLCFTGPIFGVILGGVLTQYLGGYNSTKGQLLQCLAGCLAVISGIPVPFCDNIHFMCLFLWLLLFFGGFITPQVVGIMLNSVEENKRISANSLAQLSFNLIGYLPAPTFYGFIAQISSNEHSRVPMACLLSTTIFTVSALVFSIHRKLESEQKQTILSRIIGGGSSKNGNQQNDGTAYNEVKSISSFTNSYESPHKLDLNSSNTTTDFEC